MQNIFQQHNPLTYGLQKILKSETFISILIASIIFMISINIVANVRSAREQERIVQAIQKVNDLKSAAELYKNDMGFYPPDVPRGWDPGFLKPLPWNPETSKTKIASCAHCPRKWKKIIAKQWNGPYITAWPNNTPWKGEYDYNYWTILTDRYGHNVSPGLYIGIEGDSENQLTLTIHTEKRLNKQLINHEQYLNGEVQFLIAEINTTNP